MTREQVLKLFPDATDEQITNLLNQSNKEVLNEKNKIPQYNEQAEKAVIDYAAAHGKGILVKKALASGHVCLEPGMDPIQASFTLLFAQTGVASAIVGTINPLHLAHNVATAARVIRQL